MDDMSHVEASYPDFPNPLKFLTYLIAIYVGPAVRKNAIALAFADVEGLAVSRIYQAIDVGLKLSGNSRRERFEAICAC
jgi:hypothetical protein